MNTSLNLESDQKLNELALTVTIPSYIILTTASLLGTFGNVVILIVVLGNLNLPTADKIFISNLALSDLFVTIVVDPLSIIGKLEGEKFFQRIPQLCRIIGCLCTVSCINSLGSVACVSFNRCFHICFDTYYLKVFSKRKCITMCICLYTIGAVICIPNAFGIGDHGFDQKSHQCIWDRMASYPFTVFFSVTLVWIPIIIVGISYLTILITVHKSQLRIHSHDAIEQSNFRRSVRLARTLFIIYAVFSACWIPYALLIVSDTDDTFSHVTHLYITTWAHLHPSISWLVYYLTNKKFAKAFERLLRINRCVKCKKSQTVTPVVALVLPLDPQ